MLTRVRNAGRAGHENVEVKINNTCEKILGILKTEGFIEGFVVFKSGAARMAKIDLKYYQNQAVFSAIERISKPGRRIYLPEINGGNGPRKAGAERQAINAPMQGTAADLIKLAMIAVQQALDDEGRATRMVMQVHDELVLEVPEAELDWARAEVPRLMASVATLRVPLLADYAGFYLGLSLYEQKQYANAFQALQITYKNPVPSPMAARAVLTAADCLIQMNQAKEAVNLVRQYRGKLSAAEAEAMQATQRDPSLVRRGARCPVAPAGGASGVFAHRGDGARYQLPVDRKSVV